VVLIIGMIASMAIPRMSRGATAAAEAAVLGDLNVIRNAIYRYALEHNNELPGPDAASVVAQLTEYSDAPGATAPTRTTTCVFGPYLREIPPCPIGPKAGSSEICIDEDHSPPAYQESSSARWVYNPNTGELYPNAPAEALTSTVLGPLGGGGGVPLGGGSS
jgi:type II secretory pathway pseudopilin PulG